MEHVVHAVEGPLHVGAVGDVPFDELRLLGHVGRLAARVHARLQGVDDSDLIPALEQQVNGVGTDEARAAGDQDTAHTFSITLAPS